MAEDIDQILRVWQEGFLAAGYNPAFVRQDVFGSLIEFKQYGNRNSIYGWEIDHKKSDGPDSINNYQPLQWQNNIAKSDLM